MTRHTMRFLPLFLALVARNAVGQEDRSTDRPVTGFAAINGDIKPVEYHIRNGLSFMEGDICLGPAVDVRDFTRKVREVRRGDVAQSVVITGDQYRWPDGVIPYEIDPNLPNPERVHRAIALIHKYTVLVLVERNHQEDYVRISDRGGCWSYVGRRGGVQALSVGAGCSVGNVIHELFHAAGLWHEQSREDRDAYIEIKWENIQKGREGNFQQHIDDGDDYGDYEYTSIMHYGEKYFSANGLPTIVPLQQGVSIGQRERPSAGDIFALEELYGAQPEPVQRVVKTRLRRLKPVWVAADGAFTFSKVLPKNWHTEWNVIPISDGSSLVSWNLVVSREDSSFIRYTLIIRNMGADRVQVRPRYTFHKLRRVEDE